MRAFVTALFTCVLALGMIDPALAYVGPGAGLSLLGAFWGLLAAIFAALAFVLLWPLRRIFKRRRGENTAAAAHQRQRPATASEEASLSSRPPSS